MLALNLITLHTLTVLLLVWALAGVVCRRRSRVLPEGFLFLIGIYAYAAFVMNIAEYGENMRFRLSVEPVIWLVSVWSLTIVWRAARQLHLTVARARESREAAADARSSVDGVSTEDPLEPLIERIPLEPLRHAAWRRRMALPVLGRYATAGLHRCCTTRTR